MERMASEIDYLRQQNASLLAYVLAMPVLPAHAAEDNAIRSPKARPSDVVQEALSAAAGGNAVLRRALGTYARQAKAEGIKPAEIAHTLLNWPEADDE